MEILRVRFQHVKHHYSFLFVLISALISNYSIAAWKIQSPSRTRTFYGGVCVLKPLKPNGLHCTPIRPGTLISDGDPVALLPLWESQVADVNLSDEIRQTLLEKIDHAKAIAEFGVRKAQVTFYDAFSNRNIDMMSELWSFDDSIVRCIHPGSEECLGRDAILETWSQIFSSSPSNFIIQPSRTKIEISGRTALCSCVEVTPGGGRLECLNVYRREEGSWKMILHMASPIQRMIM